MKTWNNEPHDIVEKRVIRWAVVATLLMVGAHVIVAVLRKAMEGV
jgi:hypothetical protein